MQCLKESSSDLGLGLGLEESALRPSMVRGRAKQFQKLGLLLLIQLLLPPDPAPTQPTSTPTSIPASPVPVSISGKKIALAREAQPGPSSDQAEDNTGDYHLIRMSFLMKAVGSFSSRRGFVAKMAIFCNV